MRFALLLLLLSLPSLTFAADVIPPPGAAVIVNTGATDLAGYRIIVLTSGKADARDGAGSAKGQVRQDLADAFFRDLAAAGPLSKIDQTGCTQAKPAPHTVVTWAGQQSPDLSCANAGKVLFADVQAIARALYVAAYHHKAMMIFVPYGSAGGGQTVVPIATPPPAPAGNPAPSMGGYGTYGNFCC